MEIRGEMYTHRRAGTIIALRGAAVRHAYCPPFHVNERAALHGAGSSKQVGLGVATPSKSLQTRINADFR